MNVLKPMFFILSLCAFHALAGQISVRYLRGERETYAVGDTVTLSIQINVPPETCSDGMKGTKLFQSGISIVRQSEWREIGRGYRQKEISLRITGNKKRKATLTVVRRNDKQSVTHQLQFKYIF